MRTAFEKLSIFTQAFFIFCFASFLARATYGLQHIPPPSFSGEDPWFLQNHGRRDFLFPYVSYDAHATVVYVSVLLALMALPMVVFLLFNGRTNKWSRLTLVATFLCSIGLVVRFGSWFLD